MTKNLTTATRAKGSTGQSQFRRVVGSYWVERAVFVAGAILLFSAEQLVTSRVETAREDVAYYERNTGLLQHVEASRQHWLAEYNRSVASKPQNLELVAYSAFQLFGRQGVTSIIIV